MSESVATPDSAASRRAKRTLLLIAVVCVAPIALSYAMYYLFPRTASVNYGVLLPTGPAPAIDGVRLSGAPFRLSDLAGRWVVVVNSGGGCDAVCQQALYATRQARTMQGREQERVVRLWLVTDDVTPTAALLDEHPGIVTARVAAERVAALPGGPRAIVIVDPLGNLVLRYPDDPDIKGLARDLTRLLKASSIG
jgi:hypothetical protein